MAVVHSKPTPKSVSRKDFRTVCKHHIECREIMHQGVDSCLLAAFIMAKRTARGTARFFVPIYLVSRNFIFLNQIALDTTLKLSLRPLTAKKT